MTVLRYLCFRKAFVINVSIGYKRYYSTKKWNILFFGTDSFSLKSLERIYHEYSYNDVINKLEVVTTSKRSNAVSKYALQKKLVTYLWPIEPPLENSFDVGIVVSFGHLIPQKIIDAFPLGIMNVHASLLPRWRGAAPIIHTLLNGDRHTGVTIMKIQPRHFDVGEIIKQRKVDVSEDVLQPELHNCLASIGASALAECVQTLPDCLINIKHQDDSQVTYAPKVTQNLSKVDWKNKSATEVYNLYRALYGIYPLLTQFRKHQIKLHQIKLCTETTSSDVRLQQPGYFEFEKETSIIRIWCKDGHSITCNSISISGKKQMTALDFRNGFMKNVPRDELYFTALVD